MTDSVQEVVRATLLSLGLSVDDPLASQAEFKALREVIDLVTDKEFQADLAAVRDWRKTQETARRAGVIAIIGIIISGFGGWIVWTISTILHAKH